MPSLQKDRTAVWIGATRPRTLPLATAGIVMGSSLAFAAGSFKPVVALLCLLTAALLQILSNLANDYGDSLHGADRVERKGPKRAVQSGQVSPGQMRRAIVVCAVLAMLSGLALLWAAFGRDLVSLTLLFILLGAVAVAAAVTYTAGRMPYGYAGFGDLAVLIFFGWVGVLGSYFLQAMQLTWPLFLPATSCGLLAVAVLNVNNIRDLESDRLAGKRSIPVRIGLARARMYHRFLLGGAVILGVIYVLLTYTSLWQFLFLLSVPLLVRNGQAISRTEDLPTLNPWLKQMSLTTLLFAVLFGVGQVLAAVG